jgi:hypothetical protein
LVFSVLAYNRTGEDLDDQIKSQTQELRADYNRQQARGEAAFRLAALRTQYAADKNSAAAQAEAADIRLDLAKAYSNTQGAVKEQGEQLDQQLAGIETGLRNGTGNILETIESVIVGLRRDVEINN